METPDSLSSHLTKGARLRHAGVGQEGIVQLGERGRTLLKVAFSRSTIAVVWRQKGGKFQERVV
jgi:hypothetical protein